MPWGDWRLHCSVCCQNELIRTELGKRRPGDPRPARCTNLPPACAEHGALLLISSVRRSNVISCSLLAPPLPPPPPTESCTVPFCQNLVPQATDLPIVSVLFWGWGVIAPLSKRSQGGRIEELRDNKKRRGVEILYLGCTCVCVCVCAGGVKI